MKIPGLGNLSLSGIAKSATSMLSKLPGPAGMLGKAAEAIKGFMPSGLSKGLEGQGGQSKSGPHGLSGMLQGFAKDAMTSMLGGQKPGQFAGNMLNGMLRGNGPMGALHQAAGGYGGGGGGGGGHGIGSGNQFGTGGAGGKYGGGGFSSGHNPNDLKGNANRNEATMASGMEEGSDYQKLAGMLAQKTKAEGDALKGIKMGMDGGSSLIG